MGKTRKEDVVLLKNQLCKGVVLGLEWVWRAHKAFSGVGVEYIEGVGQHKVKVEGEHDGVCAAAAQVRWACTPWEASPPTILILTDLDKSSVQVIAGKNDKLSKELAAKYPTVTMHFKGAEQTRLKVRGPEPAVHHAAADILRHHNLSPGDYIIKKSRTIIKPVIDISKLTASHPAMKPIMAAYPNVKFYIPEKGEPGAAYLTGTLEEVEDATKELRKENASIDSKRESLASWEESLRQKEADLKAWEARLQDWEDRLKKSPTKDTEKAKLLEMKLDDETAPHCDWTEYPDPATKRTFFYNIVTKKSQWNKPEELTILELWKEKQKAKKEQQQKIEQQKQEEQKKKAEQEKAEKLRKKLEQEKLEKKRQEEAESAQKQAQEIAKQTMQQQQQQPAIPNQAQQQQLMLQQRIYQQQLQQQQQLQLQQQMLQQAVPTSMYLNQHQAQLMQGQGQAQMQMQQQAQALSQKKKHQPPPQPKPQPKETSILEKFVQQSKQSHKPSQPTTTPSDSGVNVMQLLMKQAPPKEEKCDPSISRFLQASDLHHLEPTFAGVASMDKLLALDFQELVRLVPDPRQRGKVVDAVDNYRKTHMTKKPVTAIESLQSQLAQMGAVQPQPPQGTNLLPGLAIGGIAKAKPVQNKNEGNVTKITGGAHGINVTDLMGLSG